MVRSAFELTAVSAILSPGISYDPSPTLPALGSSTGIETYGFAHRLDPAVSTNLIAWVILLPTVHREGGFQFRIFANDHSPPHVHAIKAGGVAKVAIGGAEEAPWLIEARRLKNREVVRVMRIVEREWKKFMLAWTDIHGET